MKNSSKKLGLVPQQKTHGYSSKSAAMKTLSIFLNDFYELLTEKNFATIDNSDGKVQFSITTETGIVLNISAQEGGNYGQK